ncbi:hypothetical protein Pvag_pPag10040 (plasmid) [Pantoea vagans C9-1]|nr:hypothetical protein Pvag_pPag10040 [Pantoea vagans C9-1]
MSLRKLHSSLPVSLAGAYNHVVDKHRNAMHGN